MLLSVLGWKRLENRTAHLQSRRCLIRMSRCTFLIVPFSERISKFRTLDGPSEPWKHDQNCDSCVLKKHGIARGTGDKGFLSFRQLYGRQTCYCSKGSLRVVGRCFGNWIDYKEGATCQAIFDGIEIECLIICKVRELLKFSLLRATFIFSQNIWHCISCSIN